MPQLLAVVQGKSLCVYPSRLDSHKSPDQVLLTLASVLLKAQASTTLDALPDSVDVFDGITGLNIGVIFSEEKHLPDPVHTLGWIIQESLFALRSCAQSSDSVIRLRALRALEASCL